VPYEFLMNDLEEIEFDIEDSDYIIGKLAEKYGVSAQAMTHRLTNLLGYF